ncbi:MAG: hypothetical protein JXR76_03515 [Deltaproteobacteria bacterium]|nr:hypothetical protein [Deltaproteobacteria bacterium]
MATILFSNGFRVSREPRARAGALAGLLFLTVFSSMACDEPEEEASAVFCANQERLALRHACDITTPACQKAVFAAVKCVNGSKMAIPPIRFITEDEFRKELNLDMVSSSDSDTDSTTDTDSLPPIDSNTSTDTDGIDTSANTDEEAVANSYWDESLRLLGLLSAASDLSNEQAEEMATSVAAYYSGYYQDVTIIDRPRQGNPDELMRTLAHEFTHAVQDYEYGLDEQNELYSYDDDILIAMDNAREGDAVVRSDLAYSVLMDVPLESLYSRNFYQLQLSYYKRAIASDASPYIYAAQVLQYATGPLLVYDTYIHEGLDGINELREHFPTSSVYWMAGYDASRGQNAQSLNLPLRCGTALPPAEYTLEHRDTFGATVLYALLASHMNNGIFDVEGQWETALKWRGDSIEMFQHVTESKTALFWRIRMANANAGAQLETRLKQLLPAALILRQEDELHIFMATDATILAPWAGAYQCTAQRGI